MTPAPFCREKHTFHLSRHLKFHLKSKHPIKTDRKNQDAAVVVKGKGSFLFYWNIYVTRRDLKLIFQSIILQNGSFASAATWKIPSRQLFNGRLIHHLLGCKIWNFSNGINTLNRISFHPFKNGPLDFKSLNQLKIEISNEIHWNVKKFGHSDLLWYFQNATKWDILSFWMTKIFNRKMQLKRELFT